MKKNAVQHSLLHSVCVSGAVFNKQGYIRPKAEALGVEIVISPFNSDFNRIIIY